MHGQTTIALVLILIGFPLSSDTVLAAEDQVRILVRSFIPSSHPGNPTYMRPIPNTPGKFMIPGPFDGKCFDTDHRGFSIDPVASSRMASDAVLVSGPNPTIKPASGNEIHRAGVTIERECASGKESRRGTASTNACVNGQPAYAADLHQTQIVLTCQGRNPLVPAIGPRIDYGGTFTYDSQKKTISFKGNVGLFPAFEAYASLNGGPLIELFRYGPEGKDAKWLWDAGLGLNSHPLEVQPVTLRK